MNRPVWRHYSAVVDRSNLRAALNGKLVVVGGHENWKQ